MSSQPRSSHQQKSPDNTIAVFGTGPTAGHFCRLAIDAGYSIRTVDFGSTLPPYVHAIPAATAWYTDAKAIRRTVRGCGYVVCLWNVQKDYAPRAQLEFVQILYKCMRKETNVQVFLYQASALAPDIHGSMPIFSKILKTVVSVKKNDFLKDQDLVLEEIAKNHSSDSDHNENSNLSYIITRPSLFIRESTALSRALAASRSAPGPVPVTHVDLAEFTLNALRQTKLYNSCPYVVADSF